MQHSDKKKTNLVDSDACAITDVQQLFQAPLTKEVSQKLFNLLDRTHTDGEYLAGVMARRGTLKAARASLMRGEKLSDSAHYEYLVAFLEREDIKTLFTAMIAKLVKQKRIVVGDAAQGTEHATHFAGKPSIEKITKRLRDQAELMNHDEVEIMYVDDVVVKRRPGTQADISICESIVKENMAHYRTVGKESWDHNFFVANCEAGRMSIIEQRDAPIGFYRIDTDPLDDSGRHIGEFHLLAQYRNLGIGEKILQTISDDAERAGKKRITLRVYKNNPAKHLYERCGYEYVSDDDDKTIIMKKKI